MTETLQIRCGTVADQAAVIDLISEAAAWLGSMGTDQWARPWPSRGARDKRVFNGLRGGDTWMVEDGGKVIATITYRSSGNARLWEKSELHEPAVYVSRLVVARSHAGSGIGTALIDWAGRRALHAWAAQWIRIDVWTTNRALHNYYEKRGFEYLRTCPYDFKTYPSSALFQKPTDEVDDAVVSRFTEANGSSRELPGRMACCEPGDSAPRKNKLATGPGRGWSWHNKSCSGGKSVIVTALTRGQGKEGVMAKLHSRPSAQYRYEHYDPLDGEPRSHQTPSRTRNLLLMLRRGGKQSGCLAR